jgi:PAS domain S-box-containing protein
VRTRLVGLSLAVLVPSVLLALGGSYYIYREQQAAYQQSVRETVRALALVVDKELARREELLRSLAASPALDRGDLKSFYEAARRLAPRWDSVIVLADSTGQQLLNTRRPFPPAEPLPRNVTFPHERRIAGPEATIVSSLYMAPVGKRASFAIEVPVVRDGAVPYYVAMGTFASEMQSIFAEQPLPRGWTVALLDREGTIVARNIDPAKHVGQRAREDLIHASRSAHEGSFETQTRDGVPVQAFFSRVPRSGWTLALGVPHSQVISSARQAALLAAGGAAALLALAVGLAFVFGRRIVDSVRTLAQDAERIGQGQVVHSRRSGLVEVDSVSEALALASTTMRQSSAELEYREARFRALMDQAPFSMQIFSPDGRTVRVNPAWSRLWGLTADQIADYNVLQDPQLEKKGVLPSLRRAFAGEAVAIPAIPYDPDETLPDRTSHADPLRYVAAVAYPLKDEAGRVEQVVLVHEDITARRRAESAVRESEEKLRLLADTIPQLAWMANPDGYIFWYNRRWYEYTGTTSEEMEGWGWQSVHDPAVLPEVLARWTASIASGEPFDMVFPLKGADGTFRPFLTRVNPLRDATGRTLYWFGTNTDVSDIKRMEGALREADRRKDEFLATLAHELRNPLAPIVSSLQILKIRGVDQATLARARETIERQVNHLVRLVDDLLEMSRVVQGKIELRGEPVELGAIVASAVETAQPLIDARGHHLSVTLPPEPLIVHGDTVRLVQVLGNILTNSAKYTEPGGRIAVCARAAAGEAVVSVEDNGMGIAPGMLQRVFEPFVQGEESGRGVQGGLGIGLTLVKSLIELHGGTVEARSEGPGRGACFTVRLPLCSATSVAPGATPVPATDASPRRVLVVDDNHDAADSLAALLRLERHDVRVAYSGADALKAAAAAAPEVVFLDIGMPGMDGYETVRQLRALPGMGAARMIALTGWGQEKDRRLSAEAGFDGHLVKPADALAIQKLLSGEL